MWIGCVAQFVRFVVPEPAPVLPVGHVPGPVRQLGLELEPALHVPVVELEPELLVPEPELGPVLELVPVLGPGLELGPEPVLEQLVAQPGPVPALSADAVVVAAVGAAAAG